MIYDTYEQWCYHQKKKGGAPSKQEVWDAAAENAINAVLQKVTPTGGFESLEASGVSVDLDSASADAQEVGLKNLMHITDYTDVSPKILGNWHSQKPYLFVAVCIGVYEMTKSARYEKISKVIRDRVKLNHEKRKQEKQK